MVDPVGSISEPQHLAELVLHFTGLRLWKDKDKDRATAQLTVSYHSRVEGDHPVQSSSFAFRAPLDYEDFGELRWYLEKYGELPIGIFRERARRTEAQLQHWGNALYQASLGHEKAIDVVAAWHADHGGKRISVFLDPNPPANLKTEKAQKHRRAAAQIFALPWELLYHHEQFLFRGGDQVRVRRNLPRPEYIFPEPMAMPIRVLLVCPRPEDAYCGYIDHRASGKPLVETAKALGALMELTVLDPPTYPALIKTLQQAHDTGVPYHVLHFDGHGIFDPEYGQGSLCFEAPNQDHLVHGREVEFADAADFGRDLVDLQLPLVILDACQSAAAGEDVSSSIAAALLLAGVRSVLGMSHTVTEETAKRFNTAFYPELAMGKRIGDALLTAQHALLEDTYRGKMHGEFDLHLQDWFVPVLFQEAEDPSLFQAQGKPPSPAPQNRLGRLPAPPEHGFHGRAHLLMQMERLIKIQPYAVIVGGGGLGKTTLVTELARWLVDSHRFDCAAFVSMEYLSEQRAVIDSLGQQLLPDGDTYSVATFPSDEAALQPILHHLRQHATLLVMDNLESILPGPNDGPESEVHNAFAGFLKLWITLQQSHPRTRLLFTSRERLPEPFAQNPWDPGPLNPSDAIALVHGVLAKNGWTVEVSPEQDPESEIRQLVEVVDGHARALVLLTPELVKRGFQGTQTALHQILAQMPDDREKGLYASVALSLARLPEAVQQQIRPLAVFHGGGRVHNLAHVMDVEIEAGQAIAGALISVGLGRDCGDAFLGLAPALTLYLRRQLDPQTKERAHHRWLEAMQDLTGFLHQQFFKDTALASRLTQRELPNLMAMLDWLDKNAPPETILTITTRLETLLQYSGKNRALTQTVNARQKATKLFSQWSHAAWLAADSRINRLRQQSQGADALQAAQELLARCQNGGEDTFPEAPYATAMTHFQLGRIYQRVGNPTQALSHLSEARTRFQTQAQACSKAAARMASVCLTDIGDCLSDLGQLEEAATAYETAIEEARQMKDRRGEGTGLCQLATVRMLQKRYKEALALYEAYRKISESLNEPGSVATAWHQIARVNEEQNQWEAAEQAYRKSLALWVSQNNPSGQAGTLLQLGNLYQRMKRLDDSVRLYTQAAEAYQKLGDGKSEGKAQNNLAVVLIQQKAYAPARRALHRAIQCDEPFGLAAQPWKTWDILTDLEQAEGHQEVAAEAAAKARAAFLAYRRSGAENHEYSGKFCALTAKALQSGDTEELTQTLQQRSQDPYWVNYHPLLEKLQAILAGDRNPQLHQDPTLFCQSAVELQLLLESLD